MLPIIKGGIFSIMSKLDYKYIEKNFSTILEYCFNNSDTFSVITDFKKPHLKFLKKCKHYRAMKHWNPYLIKRIDNIQKWPGTETKEKNRAMYIYDCHKFITGIDNIPNFFLPKENKLPEDICFYRNENVWIFTISHEKTCYIRNGTKKDFDFLENTREGLRNTGDGSVF